MKRIFSLILAILMLTPVLAGCAGEAETADTLSTEDEALSPSDTDTSDTDAVIENPDDVFIVPEDGDIIYAENFDSFTDTADIISSLGWKTEGTADGACHDPTAKFTLAKEAGGNRLYIENNITDPNDTYVSILSDARFGAYAASSYTLQYDLEYTKASAGSRYIGLLTSYGGRYYDTFFVRNAGKGQHQTYDHGIWRTYDTKSGAYCSHTDDKALSNVLLGKKYSADAQVLSGISISIRYVVDREDGYRAYIRVNDDGYPASGKWVLVSEVSKSAGAYRCFNSEYGYGIALKVGGAQNGYIDNILVWAGEAEAPSDNAPRIDGELDRCTLHSFEADPLYTCSVSCRYCGEVTISHDYKEYKESTADRVCGCGAFESNENSGWKLERVPAYEGGKCSGGVYLSGQGSGDRTARISGDSRMTIVSETNAEQFTTYLAKLERYGYTRIFFREEGNNIYTQYALGQKLVYAYFTAMAGEVRVIEDRSSTNSIEKAGYVYEKKAGESTYIYQYGLPMSDGAATDKRAGNGMAYIVKCADNSLIVIDGGLYKQYDATQLAGLMAFMRQITGTKTGKVRISAWYVTHTHDDHVSGFVYFLSKYRSQISLERLAANIPSLNSPNGIIAKNRNVAIKTMSYLNEYYPGLEYVALHTGMMLSIADVTLDVIYTHEDCTLASDSSSRIGDDFNNTSTVVKLLFDGGSALITGDMNTSAMYYITSLNPAERVKCDVVQVAHHGYNEIYNLYNAAKAGAVFFPQSRKGAQLNAKRTRIYKSATAHADEQLIFFAGDGTARISFEGGRITAEKIDTPMGGDYTGWSW